MVQKNKIIISTRLLDGLREQYVPFISTLEVYQILIKAHSDVLINEKLQHFLLSLSWHDDENDRAIPFFPSIERINSSMFDNNRHFKKWLQEKSNQNKFIKNICATNDRYLVRKKNNEEIYVTPLLSDDFSMNNVEYIEKLLESIVKEGDNIYLLLHDKDLFKEQTRCYQVKACDVSSYVNEVSYPILTSLIDNGRVCVYIHGEGLDVCYDDIIQKLKDGVTQDEIVEKLKSIFAD